MRVALLIAALAAGAFIWLSDQSLPPMVASHFASSGAANGFMPRTAYLGVMLAVGVVMPTFTALLTGYALTKPGARINLANRDYWLAPERRGQTIAFLQGQMALFSIMLMLFLAYAHFLVVQANLSPALLLPFGWMIGGLGVFLTSVAIGIIWLISRFRLR